MCDFHPNEAAAAHARPGSPSPSRCSGPHHVTVCSPGLPPPRGLSHVEEEQRRRAGRMRRGAGVGGGGGGGCGGAASALVGQLEDPTDHVHVDARLTSHGSLGWAGKRRQHGDGGVGERERGKGRVVAGAVPLRARTQWQARGVGTWRREERSSSEAERRCRKNGREDGLCAVLGRVCMRPSQSARCSGRTQVEEEKRATARDIGEKRERTVLLGVCRQTDILEKRFKELSRRARKRLSSPNHQHEAIIVHLSPTSPSNARLKMTDSQTMMHLCVDDGGSERAQRRRLGACHAGWRKVWGLDAFTG